MLPPAPAGLACWCRQARIDATGRCSGDMHTAACELSGAGQGPRGLPARPLPSSCRRLPREYGWPGVGPLSLWNGHRPHTQPGHPGKSDWSRCPASSSTRLGERSSTGACPRDQPGAGGQHCLGGWANCGVLPRPRWAGVCEAQSGRAGESPGARGRAAPGGPRELGRGLG